MTSVPQQPGRRRALPPRPALLLGVSLVALFATVSRAAADMIDDQLHGQSVTIHRWLQRQGYKNVGVLKFKTQLGDAKESYYAGRLNTIMAHRLENVLILADRDGDKPLGITHDASTIAAAADKGANYDTAKDRQLLFRHQYRLAWGDQKVTVDAFLTGHVKLSNNFKYTTVTVQAFSPVDLEPITVCAFTVPTSRALLTDMNQPFFVSRGELNKQLKLPKGFDKLPPNEQKDVAEKIVEYGVPQGMDRVAVPTVPGWGVGAKVKAEETIDDVLDFRILYYPKGQVHKAVEVPRNGKNEVPTPPTGYNVYFSLRVKEPKEPGAKPERMGVVLRVNGVNTTSGEYEGRDVDQQGMWVLEPGKQYEIPGYYDGTKLHKFEALGEAESETYYLMDETKRGKIEIDIFRQIEIPEKAFALPDIRTNTTYRRSITGTGAKTIEDAAKGIDAAGKAPTARRGLIAPAKEGAAVDIPRTPLDNVLHTGHLAITYYKK